MKQCPKAPSDSRWRVALGQVYARNPTADVHWGPILDIAKSEPHYTVYITQPKYSSLSMREKELVYQGMMWNWYRRTCCKEIRSPQRTKHGLVQGVKGAPRMADKVSSAKNNPITNAARKADGRMAVSNALHNPINSAARKADGRMAISNAVLNEKAKAKRKAVSAAERQEYRCEHAGDGGVFVPVDTIQEVLTRRHLFDSSKYGSRPRIKKLTIKQALASEEFAIYIGLTKQRIGSFDDWLSLTNKSLHDEPFR
jgi:hypothetical protein